MSKGTLECGVRVAADALPNGHNRIHANRVGPTTDLSGVLGACHVAVGRVNLRSTIHDSSTTEALRTILHAGVGKAQTLTGRLACLNRAARYVLGGVERAGERAVRVAAQTFPGQRGRDSAIAVVSLTPAATVVGATAAPTELRAAVTKGATCTGGGAVIGSADTGGRYR